MKVIYSFLILILLFACGHYKTPQPTQEITAYFSKQHFINIAQNGWYILGKTGIKKQTLDANNKLIEQKALKMNRPFEIMLPYNNNFVFATTDSIFVCEQKVDSIKILGKIAKYSLCDKIAVANEHLYIFSPKECLTSNASTPSIKIISLKDPQNLKLQALFNISEELSDIQTDGNLVFGLTASGVNIYDTKNPLSPVLANNIPSVNTQKISIRDKKLWLTEKTQLRQFDYQNATSPKLLMTVGI